MAKDAILLHEVAARDARMIEMRCGRCDRKGRLSVQRLLARMERMHRFAALCRTRMPEPDAAQIQNRCDPYFPDLVRLFGVPEAD